MTQTTLATRLSRVRRRLMIVGGSAAIVWGCLAALLMLTASVWLDLVWELSPRWRIALVGATLAVSLLAIARLARFLLAEASGQAVAARVDRAGATGGVVLSGWQLACRWRPLDERALTAGLAELAVEHASAVTAAVPVREAVPARPLVRPALATLASLAAVAVVAVCFPALARTEWRRFTFPWSDVPAYSRNTFEVQPGDAEVLYGGDLAVAVTVFGPPVERVELVLQSSRGEEIVPMFADSGGKWQTSLSRIIEPAGYHVRAHRARSRHYQIRVVTIPRIEQVRVEIVPPDYTGLAPYSGAVPKDGIAGLPATKVSLFARSNRPLSGGAIALRGKTETTEVAMQPLGENQHEVVGQFNISGDAKLVLAITDEAGQASRETYEASIILLVDETPFVRLLQPRPQSLATPAANLPVVVSAEDDYGLSSVKLYRSLNDSRAMPAEIPTAPRVSRRVYEQLYLPLGQYGVQPGDEIKLFARAEDNDPAGAKGSESTVVVVTTISQEEFDRMTVIRRGLESLTSKYREVRRRLESLAAEMESLRDELAKADPGSVAAKEMRKRLQDLQKRFQQEADAIRKLGENRLPFDFDEYLKAELEKAAGLSQELAQALQKLAEEEAARNADLAAQLAELLKRLGGQRDEFEQAAIEPLEWLEGIFPLIADQSRFVTLVLRQMDLAERLASLKGIDSVDAGTKARMRDLEEQQRQIRNDLSTLLDDIKNHAESLPDDERLDVLHDTAMKFVKDVRESGVFEAMTDAETALAEFSGTEAHEKVRLAAEILQKFLSLVEGGQGPAGQGKPCLAFQPTLARGLGDTIGQLLAAMGLSSGLGADGLGAGGYSAARNSSIGLYGGLPTTAGSGDGPVGQALPPGGNTTGGTGSETYGGANLDRDSLTDLPGMDQASGTGSESIPPRYRRKVGQYFQRLADEAGTP